MGIGDLVERVDRWWSTDPAQASSASASAVVVGGPGDVAQVRDLGASVAGAFGLNLDSERVTRAQALSIPAVYRGRQIIVGTISGLPMQAWRQSAGNDGAEVPDTRPVRIRRSLLEQPQVGVTRQWVLGWTVDDLLFHGLAWWRVVARDTTGFPSWVEYLTLARVRVDYARGVVLVDGVPQRDGDLIRFDLPGEGLLDAAAAHRGANPLVIALKLERAAGRYADLDVPTGLLSDKRSPGAGELGEVEIDRLLDRWAESRRKRSTGWLGRTLQYQPVQFTAEQLQLVASREHASTEIARLMNLEAQAVSAPGASGLTYSNTEAIRRGRIDALAPYLDAIGQRLSLPDVTPRGQAVSFDTSGYIRGDEQTVVGTAATAVRNGLATPNEARARWLSLPALDGGDVLGPPAGAAPDPPASGL